MSRRTILIRSSAITAVLRFEQSVCLAPMVLAFSAYLGGLACLAIDKPTDVVIGKALRDTPLGAYAPTQSPSCRTDAPNQSGSRLTRRIILISRITYNPNTSRTTLRVLWLMDSSF